MGSNPTTTTLTNMRIALLIVATLAIAAAASVPETTFSEEVTADVPHTRHIMIPKQAAKTADTDILLQEEREQIFHEASTRVKMHELLQSDSMESVKGKSLRPGYYKIQTTGVHAGHSAAQPAGWGLSAWGAHGAVRNHASSWVAVHSGNYWPMIWKIEKSKRVKGTYTIKTTKYGPKNGKMKAGWGLSSWHAHGAVRNGASSRVAVHSGNYWLMDWAIKPSTRTKGAWTIKTAGGPKNGKQPKGWGLAAWQKHGGRRNSASSWVYTHAGNHWLMDWKMVWVKGLKVKGVKRGFKAQFYHVGGLSNVGQAMNRIRGKGANKSMTVNRIRYGTTGGHWHGLNNSFNNNYVAKFTGFIHITRAGRYTFWTNSDDGSRLYINNRLVVNNDGLHGMRTRAGAIHLKPGSAKAVVYFFERTGGAGLIVDWAGPGFGRRPLDGRSVFDGKVPKKKPVGLASCTSNAKKSIQSVIHEVKNAQGILNRMDNGARCKNKGANLVKSAKNALARKITLEKQAKKVYYAAQNAPIKVKLSFSSGNRNCNAFTSSAQWQAARRNVSRKKNSWTKAKQQVVDARKYLSKMEAKAAADRCSCKRRVTKAAQNAVVQARRLSAERKRPIIRELMVICLANAAKKKGAAARNNAGNVCKSQKLPAAYAKKLHLHQTKLVKFGFKCSKLTCGGLSGKHVYVAALNKCLKRLGAKFYHVQWIEVAYGKTNYLTNICRKMFGGASRYIGTIGGDRCSSSAAMYPSYCGQGWLGRKCNNGCGNANYAGFRCA